MEPQKFVVRLLSADATLLAWAQTHAEPKPQDRGASCPFWPIDATRFIVEQSGEAVELSIHWCELDVARRRELVEPVHVEAGQMFDFHWIEPIWLVPGTRDVPLPAVTVREPIVISTPTGMLMSAPPL